MRKIKIITMPPQRHPLDCSCIQCRRFWKKMKSTQPLSPWDLDWLDKIAVTIEEDRTPEAEAALAGRLRHVEKLDRARLSKLRSQK